MMMMDLINTGKLAVILFCLVVGTPACTAPECHYDAALLSPHVTCDVSPFGGTPPCYGECSAIINCACDDPAYTISDAGNSYCCSGAWDPDVYNVKCTGPCTVDAGENVISKNSAGNVTETIDSGDFVMYSCPEGYSGTGSAQVGCTDGVWDTHQQFNCLAQTCDNGQLTSVTLCTHDVAEGKKTKQHSTYSQDGKSENAVNGNTSGHWRTRSCTGTKWSTNPWWTVDLGASYQVGSIHIYNRVDGNFGQRLLGAQVLAGTEADPLRNDIIGTIGPKELLDNPIVFTLDKTVTHVSVRLPGNSKHLTLCGVEVYGVPL